MLQPMYRPYIYIYIYKPILNLTQLLIPKYTQNIEYYKFYSVEIMEEFALIQV